MDPFDGLFGVFADSLPDGWGRFLVDRLMLKKGIEAAEDRVYREIGPIVSVGRVIRGSAPENTD